MFFTSHPFLVIVGSGFDKKENNSPNQLILKPMFLKLIGVISMGVSLKVIDVMIFIIYEKKYQLVVRSWVHNFHKIVFVFVVF